jgi:hypothetical protein
MATLDIFLIIGVLLIILSIIVGIACLIIFNFKKKKLKTVLEEEYGDPTKYNLKIRE